MVLIRLRSSLEQQKALKNGHPCKCIRLPHDKLVAPHTRHQSLLESFATSNRKEWADADLYVGSLWKSVLTILQALLKTARAGVKFLFADKVGPLDMTLLDVARSGHEVDMCSDNSYIYITINCHVGCCNGGCARELFTTVQDFNSQQRFVLQIVCFSKHPSTKVFTIDQISAQLGQPLMTISPPTTAMLVCLDAFYHLPFDPCKLVYRCIRSNGGEIWGAYRLHLHQCLVSIGSPFLLRLSVIFLNFGCLNILVAVMVEHIVSIAAETRQSFSKAS